MRCFIAIEIPDEIRGKISEFSEKCSKIQSKNIKYVNRKNYHITLKFLGETDKNRIKSISMELNKLKNSKFIISINNSGGFPDIVFPKVLWVGIGLNDELKMLFREVEDISVKLGFKAENRGFNPHLTIARIKGNLQNELAGFLKKSADIEFGSFTAQNISLFESELTGEGPVYTKINTFPLL